MVELGTLITQAKTVRCGESNYPVLSMTMHDGLVLQDDRFKKAIASKDKSDYKVVYRDQLVISFPIDEGVLATQRITDAGIVSPAYGIWDVDQEKVVPEFLEYALRCKRSIAYYKAKLRGSTARRRSLPTPTLLAHTVPLPSIEEQKYVLDLIHKVETIIHLRKDELKELDALTKARFVEMFGDPIKNDKTWPVSKLQSLTTKIGSGATPKGGKQSYKKEGITLVRSMNVYDGEFVYKDLAHIDTAQAQELNNVELKPNDVFINITGASVARSCVIPNNILPGRVNQHVAIIRCKENILNCIFLNRLFLNASFRQKLLAMGQAGGATRQALTKEQLRNLNLILPPIELQNKFASFVQQVDKSKVVIQKSLDETQTLFDSLMQKYFS